MIEGRGSSPLTRGKQTVKRVSHILERLIPAHAGKTLVPAGRMVIGGAHPRSRGENLAAVGDAIAALGSSPLTRGKLLGAGQYTVRDRLIPAHAGKTTRHAPPDSHREAHPRSRGENVGTPLHETCETGSSPLTRGKQG